MTKLRRRPLSPLGSAYVMLGPLRQEQHGAVEGFTRVLWRV